MKKWIAWTSILVLVSSAALTACQPPRNPPLNSVVSAHGNSTDWHIDTAEEFLFGTEISGATTAANHVPDSWTRRHVHIGGSNTNVFYYDADKIASGADTDATNGIETAMLFFYAGHGDPDGWDTLGNVATQSNMSLGDYLDGGLLRYYWQCSCEVFAHGPKSCTNSTWDYGCPGKFAGYSDSDSHRNVFERWGPVLNDDLRMACGVSTSAYCHEDQVNRIWNNYNNNSYDVADSFIDGLNWWGVVPLCITKGNYNIALSPLYDTSFTNQPNTSGNSHYHIQYLSNFSSTEIDPAPRIRIPELMPIFEIIPLPFPDPIADLPFNELDGWLVSPEIIDPLGPAIRVNPISGAVYVRGPNVQNSARNEEEYIELAFVHAKEQGWLDDKTFSGPYGEAMMLVSQPIEGSEEVSEPLQKNVIITFRRMIEVEGIEVNVLGEGGVIRIQMNNDGSLRNGSIVWREIAGVIGETRTKSYEQALQEALEQMKTPDAYQLDQWNWGYKEEAGNVEQTELHLVFQFTFVPVNPELQREHPPQMIEIGGELR